MESPIHGNDLLQAEVLQKRLLRKYLPGSTLRSRRYICKYANRAACFLRSRVWLLVFKVLVFEVVLRLVLQSRVVRFIPLAPEMGRSYLGNERRHPRDLK